MAMNKRKITTVIVAGVTAVALLLGGTFAWTSISQQAKNESAGIVNVGGRLHDDFNGTNKDVYVENFTDPNNGGQPIYARVKLTEYMEVGSEAGQVDNADRNATPVVNGTSIDDPDNWPAHIPITDDTVTDPCPLCDSGDTHSIHDHWKWTMGGETTFMPTFNKDKDSLEADINGTYAGTDDTDKIYYDDYVVYTTVENDGVNNNIAFDAKEAYEGEIYSVTGTAYYDNDPNMDPNDYDVEAELGGYKTETETHTAKDTVNGSVITMDQWINDYDKAPGDYWVYDTDGWAYWANPIMPGEATGLLLDSIEMTKNPGEKCYYAINVVGQFATVGDWEHFDGELNENVEELLGAASENVPAVTVVNVDGKTLVNRGETVSFSATTSVGAVSTLADDEYDWYVLDEELKESETSSITVNDDGTATLKVGEDEFSPSLYVAARSRNHGGAVGTSAVAVQLYTVTVTKADNAETVEAGDTLQFYASVMSNKGENKEGVTWSLSGHTHDGTSIDENGLLTVNKLEKGDITLTVTATTKATGAFVGSATVTVANQYFVGVTAAGDATTVNDGETLQFTAEVIRNDKSDPDSAVIWSVTVPDGVEGVAITDGLLTVPEGVAHGTEITVTATVADNPEFFGNCKVTVNRVYTVDLTAEGNATTVEAGDTLRLTAAVTHNGKTDNSGVNWDVSGGATISEDGLLSVFNTTAHGTEITVTATSKKDPAVSDTYTVAVNRVYGVTVSANNNATTVTVGYTLQFSADVTYNGKTDTTSGVTWKVTGGSGTTSINTNGLLTVDKNEKGAAVLTVTATSKEDNTAIGTCTVTVNKYAVTVSAANGANTVDAGDTLDFTATVKKNNQTDTSGVNWTVSGANGVTISESGLLSVPTSVMNGTELTVTATSKEDSTVKGTKTVIVYAEYVLNITPSSQSVAPGGTIQHTAMLSVNGIQQDVTSAVDWKVTDASGNAVDNATIDANGKLMVNDTTYDSSSLKITAVHNRTNTTGSATATVNYTLTLDSTDTFTLDGLRVNVNESYYSIDDISAALSNNTGTTRYNAAVLEGSSGVYIMITHDDTYYAFEDHGTRTLTVTGPEGKTASRDFACESHTNKSYTVKTVEGETILNHEGPGNVHMYMMELWDGNSSVSTGKRVFWSAQTNSGTWNTEMVNDRLRLSADETSPYVTVTYRTENAWGSTDLRIRYPETDAVKGMELQFMLSIGGVFGHPNSTVKYGQNSNDPELGDTGRTYLFRIYDADDKVIDEPLNFTIWQGDINITGAQHGYACTNGYDDADTSVWDDGDGSYWIWVPAGNTTPITFWISYEDASDGIGTFEATIW